MLKAVIFDLFHTLTGLESEWSDLPWTSDILGIDRRTWDRALTQNSRWRLAGEERDPYLILEKLARDINPGISAETLRKAVSIRTARFRHSLQKIPAQNIRTVERLRKAGLRVGLISNADVMEVAAWTDSPLAGRFDAEIFSCNVGCVKPEPAIFNKCLDTLGLKPSECVFVGDGSSNELHGAKEVGLTTVFVSGVIAELWPERIPERITVADYHIAWVPEIFTVLDLVRDQAVGQTT